MSLCMAGGEVYFLMPDAPDKTVQSLVPGCVWSGSATDIRPGEVIVVFISIFIFKDSSSR